jgi:hypothetical protein
MAVMLGRKRHAAHDQTRACQHRQSGLPHRNFPPFGFERPSAIISGEAEPEISREQTGAPSPAIIDDGALNP